MFSKFMTTALIVSTLSGSFYSKKADAGVFIAATGGITALYHEIGRSSYGDGSKAAEYLAISGAITLALGGIAGQVIKIAKIVPNGDQISYVFMLLDGDSAEVDFFTKRLQVSYPFIDDASGLAELSQVIADKYHDKKDETGAFIQVSEKELSPILKRMNLSAKERKQIITDLK